MWPKYYWNELCCIDILFINKKKEKVEKTDIVDISERTQNIFFKSSLIYNISIYNIYIFFIIYNYIHIYIKKIYIVYLYIIINYFILSL